MAQRYLAAKVVNKATARHEVCSVVSQLIGRTQLFDRVRCLGGDGALSSFVSSACGLSVDDDLTSPAAHTHARTHTYTLLIYKVLSM